eukprot:6381-Heterococcus_DN1.PRE.2
MPSATQSTLAYNLHSTTAVSNVQAIIMLRLSHHYVSTHSPTDCCEHYSRRTVKIQELSVPTKNCSILQRTLTCSRRYGAQMDATSTTSGSAANQPVPAMSSLLSPFHRSRISPVDRGVAVLAACQASCPCSGSSVLRHRSA